MGVEVLGLSHCSGDGADCAICARPDVHSGQFERLQSRLETLPLLKKQWDIWGIVGERLVLLSNELPTDPSAAFVL